VYGASYITTTGIGTNMLLGNYSVLNKLPLRAIGGQSVSDTRANWNKSGMSRGFYSGDHRITNVTDRSAIPNGYRPPYSWILAPKTGMMSSFGSLVGDGEMTAQGQNGLPATANLAGSGQITNAAMGLIVEMLATLAGSGNLTASIVGQLQASATLAGSGNLTAAQSALAGLVANLTGSGAITGALATALGQMAATIYVNQSQATVDQIVEGVVDGIGSVTATIPNLLNTETGDLIIPL
jgi:hypothetical protein